MAGFYPIMRFPPLTHSPSLAVHVFAKCIVNGDLEFPMLVQERSQDFAIDL
jgi:hypothetical protein